jgi:hypothetical protein
MAQISTQFYLANDSCTFYLLDYTEIVTVSDNCEVMAYVQTPEPGTRLQAGSDIIVTLEVEDYSGNISNMQFDVVLIDEMPPKFHIPDTLLIPTGQWQNAIRTYHFYTYVEDSAAQKMVHFYE